MDEYTFSSYRWKRALITALIAFLTSIAIYQVPPTFEQLYQPLIQALLAGAATMVGNAVISSTKPQADSTKPQD